MPKKKKKRRGASVRTPGRERRTDSRKARVHVQVAHAAGHLDSATALVKPAILYADKVTIYSPAASLLADVRQLARISKPDQQLALLLELVAQVPALGEQLGDIEPETIAQLTQLLSLKPAAV